MTQDTRPPTTHTIDYAALVKKLIGAERSEKEVVYEFSNGRKFKSTDHTESGIYDKSN